MDIGKNGECSVNPAGAEEISDCKQNGEHAANRDDTAETNNSEEKESRWGGFSRKFIVGNLEVTFNSKSLESPVEILEKLYCIGNDENLTNEEKSKQVEKIMKEYME